MFKLLLVIAFVACVAAFAPTSRVRTSASLSMEFSKSLPFLKAPKNTVGLIGSSEFDPFGFSDYYDIKWMQEAELKHCRVAMLATVGWLVQVLPTIRN